MALSIKEALTKLSPDENSNWTEDGAPVVAVISGLVGRPVTRKEITESNPGFCRSSIVDTKTTEVLKEVGKEDLSILPDREFYRRISSFKDFELEDLLQELTETRNFISKEIEDLQISKEITSKRYGWVREKLSILKPPLSNQEAIQQYLEKQKELSGSQLSSVMKRKTSFGGKRPNYPVTG